MAAAACSFGTDGSISFNFPASDSMIIGTKSTISGWNSFKFLWNRMIESLMQMIIPMEMPFIMSMVRQYTWLMGRTVRDTVP